MDNTNTCFKSFIGSSYLIGLLRKRLASSVSSSIPCKRNQHLEPFAFVFALHCSVLHVATTSSIRSTMEFKSNDGDQPQSLRARLSSNDSGQESADMRKVYSYCMIGVQ
uniref:Uncharacterized protein n=1 Tax=Romanomermis culicivorax TaxID=13658 RepID=A0A915KLL3_ROMCU